MKSEGNSTSSSEAPKSETTSETVKSETPKSETATASAAKTLPETGENDTFAILNYVLSVLTLGASLTLFVTTLKKKK